MADIPFPITADSFDGIRRQVGELTRILYEEKIGGADLGDVFSLPGDVLTLNLADTSGLTKSGGELAIDPTPAMAVLSGQAGAAFSFNSQNLTSVGTIGCGAITTTGDLTIPDGGVIRTVTTDNALTIDALGKVGFGTATPAVLGGYTYTTQNLIHVYGNGVNAALIAEGAIASIELYNTGGGANQKWFTMRNLGGSVEFSSLKDDASNWVKEDIFNFNLTTGLVGLTYNVSIGGAALPATLAKGMVFALGTDPTADVANQCSVWASDFAAGNTCLTTRSENGGIIQLAQQAKASYNNWAAFTDVVDALVAMGIFDAA